VIGKYPLPLEHLQFSTHLLLVVSETFVGERPILFSELTDSNIDPLMLRSPLLGELPLQLLNAPVCVRY